MSFKYEYYISYLQDGKFKDILIYSGDAGLGSDTNEAIDELALDTFGVHPDSIKNRILVSYQDNASVQALSAKKLNAVTELIKKLISYTCGLPTVNFPAFDAKAAPDTKTIDFGDGVVLRIHTSCSAPTSNTKNTAPMILIVIDIATDIEKDSLSGVLSGKILPFYDTLCTIGGAIYPKTVKDNGLL